MASELFEIVPLVRSNGITRFCNKYEIAVRSATIFMMQDMISPAKF